MFWHVGVTGVTAAGSQLLCSNRQCHISTPHTSHTVYLCSACSKMAPDRATVMLPCSSVTVSQKAGLGADLANVWEHALCDMPNCAGALGLPDVLPQLTIDCCHCVSRHKPAGTNALCQCRERRACEGSATRVIHACNHVFTHAFSIRCSSSHSIMPECTQSTQATVC